ncbi:MAG: hypothetical protein M3R00_09635, partial [Pseudomonadota bacterium]|nr:hypothetical protein [Pseudomonadota bacterium]
MQGSQEENEKIAVAQFLQLTIQQGIVTDESAFVPDDGISGKTVAELLLEAKLIEQQCQTPRSRSPSLSSRDRSPPGSPRERSGTASPIVRLSRSSISPRTSESGQTPLRMRSITFTSPDKKNGSLLSGKGAIARSLETIKSPRSRASINFTDPKERAVVQHKSGIIRIPSLDLLPVTQHNPAPESPRPDEESRDGILIDDVDLTLVAQNLESLSPHTEIEEEIFEEGSENEDTSNWQEGYTSAEMPDSDFEDMESKHAQRRILLSPRRLRKPIRGVSLNLSKMGDPFYFEERLDPFRLHLLITATILICHHKDGPENYRAMPCEKNPIMVKHQLERIGGGRSFVKPISNGKLHSASVILCLDAMLGAMHPKARRHILSIKVETFAKWLLDIAGSEIMLRQGLAEELFCKFENLQRMLRKNKSLFIIELLKIHSDQFYQIYSDAFEQADPFSRYNVLPINSFIEAELVSSKSQNLAVDEWKLLPAIRDDLMLGNVIMFSKLKSPIYQAHIVNGFKYELHASRFKFRKAISTLLTELGFDPEELTLRYAMLTDKEFSSMLKTQGKTLHTLDVSSCRAGVKQSLFFAIMQHCPELKSLRMRNVVFNLLAERLTTITELDVSDTQTN